MRISSALRRITESRWVCASRHVTYSVLCGLPTPNSPPVWCGSHSLNLSFERAVNVRLSNRWRRQSPPCPVFLSGSSTSDCPIGSHSRTLSSRTAVRDLPPVRFRPTRERFFGCAGAFRAVDGRTRWWLPIGRSGVENLLKVVRCVARSHNPCRQQRRCRWCSRLRSCSTERVAGRTVIVGWSFCFGPSHFWPRFRFFPV